LKYSLINILPARSAGIAKNQSPPWAGQLRSKQYLSFKI